MRVLAVVPASCLLVLGCAQGPGLPEVHHPRWCVAGDTLSVVVASADPAGRSISYRLRGAVQDSAWSDPVPSGREFELRLVCAAPGELSFTVEAQNSAGRRSAPAGPFVVRALPAPGYPNRLLASRNLFASVADVALAGAESTDVIVSLHDSVHTLLRLGLNDLGTIDRFDQETPLDDLACMPDGVTIYATHDDELVKIRFAPGSSQVLMRRRLNAGIADIVLSADGHRLLVSTAETLYVLSTPGDSAVAVFPVDDYPSAVAFSADGLTAYMLDEWRSELRIVDCNAGLAVDSVPVELHQPDMLCLNGDLLYAGGWDVAAVSITQRRLLRKMGANRSLAALAASPDGAELYVTFYDAHGRFLVCDGRTLAPVDSFDVAPAGVPLGRIRPCPNGERIVLGNRDGWLGVMGFGR